MKQRVEEMEREAKKLREMQAAAEANTGTDESEGRPESDEDKAASDIRSIYIGNVRFVLMITLHAHVLLCPLSSG